jgi:hypothetical protein
VETLNERDQARVRAGYTAVQANVNKGEITNQAPEARRSARGMSWPVYAREVDQREELREAKQNGAALEYQRPILDWADLGRPDSESSGCSLRAVPGGSSPATGSEIVHKQWSALFAGSAGPGKHLEVSYNLLMSDGIAGRIVRDDLRLLLPD